MLEFGAPVSDLLVLGFTGTQAGMSPAQKWAFTNLLLTYYTKPELHHGDCVGADADAHEIAYRLGCSIAIHPPENPSKRAFCQPAASVRSPRPYLDRNRDIVNDTRALIATPKGREELRSGTWATVRHARRTGKPVLVIWPDGSSEVNPPERWDLYDDEVPF